MLSFRFRHVVKLILYLCTFVALLFCLQEFIAFTMSQLTSKLRTFPTVSRHPNIIFIETKLGKRYLSPREACVVESAALQHPHGQISYYNVNGPLNARDEHVSNLIEHYSNIFFEPLHLSTAFAKTPLEQWHKEKRILESVFPIEHLSDALRLAILWKTGGVYMDTDCLVVNDMSHLNNSVGYEIVTGMAANGVLIFPKASPFIYLYMQTLAENFNGTSWHGQGPHMLSKLLQKICNVSILYGVVDKPHLCDGIRLLPDKMFYPIPWTRWRTLISKNQEDYSTSYSVHLYGSLSRDFFVEVGEESFLEILFQRHCPKTYQLILKLQLNFI